MRTGKDRDRYKVAKCIQEEPVFCGFGRSAHSKVISVSVLRHLRWPTRIANGKDSRRGRRTARAEQVLRAWAERACSPRTGGGAGPRRPAGIKGLKTSQSPRARARTMNGTEQLGLRESTGVNTRKLNDDDQRDGPESRLGREGAAGAG